MIIYPAIDLIDGQCVRLNKGDFDQQTTYDLSPVSVAQSYKESGAQWLHLVDLDGARDPNKRQIAIIQDIIEKSDLNVQTGGGIRSREDVESLLTAGASRVVIGSMAVKNKTETKDILTRYGSEKICIAADIKNVNGDYKIAVSGWQEESTVSLNDFLESYKREGLKHVLCTDISKDGMMQGCNHELYDGLKKDFPDLRVQASGGVHSLDDIRALETDGVIIGKALYEGAFDLSDALEAAKC